MTQIQLILKRINKWNGVLQLGYHIHIFAPMKLSNKIIFWTWEYVGLSLCDNFDIVMSYYSLNILAAKFTIQLTDIHRILQNGLQFFILYNIVSVAMSLIWCTVLFRLFPSLVHDELKVMQQVTEYICVITHVNFSDWVATKVYFSVSG